MVLEEHDLAPDGSFAVVVRRIVERNRYLSHLWLVPLDGGPSLARGASRPAPSATPVRGSRRTAGGSRSSAGCPTTLAPSTGSASSTLDRASARPWAVSRPHHEVSVAEWSPDGGRLAFTAAVDPPRFIVGPAAAPGEAPLARVIRRIDWRFDEEGFLDRWSHLFVVEASRGAAPRQLTEGDWGVGRIAWHPDGSTIAFAADRRADADLNPGGSIWIADAGDAPGICGARDCSSRSPAGRAPPRGRRMAAGWPSPASTSRTRPTRSARPSSSDRPTVVARRSPWIRTSTARSATGSTRT